MIVISDGSPTRTSFFDPNNPVSDTMLAIKEARRKGLRIFGAVVDDYENVSEIYGKDYSFDCSYIMFMLLPVEEAVDYIYFQF